MWILVGRMGRVFAWIFLGYFWFFCVYFGVFVFCLVKVFFGVLFFGFMFLRNFGIVGYFFGGCFGLRRR